MVLEAAFLKAVKSYQHLPDSVWSRVFALLDDSDLESMRACGCRRFREILEAQRERGEWERLHGIFRSF